MRFALCLLVLISIANLGLQLDLRRRLAAAVPAPEAPRAEPPFVVHPDLLEGLRKDWPWRPDGTMPPR